MSNRKAISKKIRFELFKRDNFKCQYCGASAPDVILEPDHIHPVSKGGDNDLMNLITSCYDCNRGKGARTIQDDSVLTKQRAQLEELNIRREQLEQLLKWRNELKNIDSVAFEAARNEWENYTIGFTINEFGEKNLRKDLAKYGLNTVLDAIEKASHGIRTNSDGTLTPESVNDSFNKIGAICKVSLQPDWKRELYYIRGIVRNRLSYCNQQLLMTDLELAYNSGISTEDLKGMALSVRNWSQLRTWIRESVEAINGTR